MFKQTSFHPYPGPDQQAPATGPGSAAEPVTGKVYHCSDCGCHADYACPRCGTSSTDYTPEPGVKLVRCTRCGEAFLAMYRAEDMP